MHGENKKSGFFRVEYVLGLMYYQDKKEIGRVQALRDERSFTIVLPKEFAVELGIGKGEFLKCRVDSQRLVLEKVESLHE